MKYARSFVFLQYSICLITVPESKTTIMFYRCFIFILFLNTLSPVSVNRHFANFFT